MKFAIAIALFVLGQCIVADAWYVSCRAFNRERSNDRNDRSSLHRYADDVTNQKNGIYSRINALQRRLSSSQSSLNSLRSYVTGLKSESTSFADFVKVLKKRIEDLSKKLEEYEKSSPCAYDNDNMLFCIIREFMES